jgi:hypothetical protein
MARAICSTHEEKERFLAGLGMTEGMRTAFPR